MKTNMKLNRITRLIAISAVTALAGMLIISAAVFAAGPGNGIHTPGTGLSADVVPMGPQGGRYGGAYRSGYGSGLLSNRTFEARPGFVDADGDGVCDNLGTGQGLGANFVDENGDGVCDYLGAGQPLGLRPMVNGSQGTRMGGMGFVDANGDGVCDYLQAAQ